ncbi:MAG: hypothetical protein MJ059_02230 [Lachnospiraceae bacterium]|nr:hypothetical protein [Lachnospiraceae bacterium]
MGNDILNIHCPSCGAPARYDIIRQVYKCSYCGGKVEIEDALNEKQEFKKKSLQKMRNNAESFPLMQSSCTGCGATIIFEENEALANCAFCGRSLARKKFLYRDDMPVSVIPFSVTEDEAQERLAEWCRKNHMKREARNLLSAKQELKGFYLPYEMVSGPVKGSVSCTKGTRKYEFGGFIKDEFINCSGQLDNILLDAMEPFDLEAMEEFDFGYVAGQRVKVTDIDKNKIDSRLRDEVSKNYTPSLQKMWGTHELNVMTKADSVIKLPVLLPVYYIKNGNIQAAVNGQTGKVSVLAEKESFFVSLPWWLSGLLVLVLAIGATFLALWRSGFEIGESLTITGALGVFYLIVYLCMFGDFNQYRGGITKFRKIFTSGEQTFRRDRGRLVPSDRVLSRKVEGPVFFETLDGKTEAVSYLFRSTGRMALTVLLCMAAIFLPVIIALFLNGFDFGRLTPGGSAVWFCITVPTVPVYFIVYGIVSLYDRPWIYVINEDGSRKRYRKKVKLTAEKVREALKVVAGLLFVPPLCLATWFAIAAFCVMCYLTAFGW